jgi:hypothetical protein
VKVHIFFFFLGWFGFEQKSKQWNGKEDSFCTNKYNVKEEWRDIGYRSFFFFLACCGIK